MRARRTAEVAASAFGGETKGLESLIEYDFGPLTDGMDVNEARALNVKTYMAWSVGYVDEAPEGGESARQVRTNRMH